MPSLLLNPLFVFSIVLFLSAFFMFWVELMLGKMILPIFGGTPAVWTTCMNFFQIVLLAGYSYAHLVSSRMPLRKQLMFHSCALIVPLVWFVFFPLGINRGFAPPNENYPALWVILLLAMLIGLPFLVISTSAPLMQRWFAQTGHPAAKDPYFLYAASNLGSMLGLFGYIAAVEPMISIKVQGILWMLGFACLVGLTFLCAYLVRRGPVMALELAGMPPAPASSPPNPSEQIKAAPSENVTDSGPTGNGTTDTSASDGSSDPPATQGVADPPSEGKPTESEQITEKPAAAPVAVKGAKRWRKQRDKVEAEAITRTVPAAKKTSPKATQPIALPELGGKPTLGQMIHWVLLALVPSSLMLGATTYMTTDIAAVPLFWTIPLGIYLLSFILVFSRLPKWVHQAMVLSLPVVVLLLAFMLVSEITVGLVWRFVLHLVALFIVCMVCHGELARARPATQYLTGFFLLMSFGGVLGGTLNAMIAPIVFNTVAEYPLMLVTACLLLPAMGVDIKSTLNRYIDNALAIGLGLAALYALVRWGNEIMEYTKGGGEVNWAKYFYIPGIKPEISHALWSVLGIVLILYVGLPKWRPLVRVVGERKNWLTRLVDNYVEYRKQPWLDRFLDVALPVALFLLTAELIRRSPFDSWKFDWLARMFKVEEARVVQVFTYGLPVALCYGFAEQPIRFGLGVGAFLLAGAWQSEQGHVLYQDRSFFGVLKVEKAGSYHRLLHGTTLHGMQRIGSNEALTYYHRTGPVGEAYNVWINDGKHTTSPVAFIGLGTGTMASYINKDQTATFYEIDTSVIHISQDLGYFTYLKDCTERNGKYVFDVGDARLKLRNAPDHSYRLIVVDAFSSDAIPIHLITKEAVQLYFEKLTEDGVACIHISNRHLELGPVLGNIAKELNLSAVQMYDHETEVGKYLFAGKNSSDWVMLAKKPEYTNRLKWFDSFTSLQGMLDFPEQMKNSPYASEREKARRAQNYQDAVKVNILASMVRSNALQLLADESHWNDLQPEPTQSTWTDDFSNILSIFRWR